MATRLVGLWLPFASYVATPLPRVVSSRRIRVIRVLRRVDLHLAAVERLVVGLAAWLRIARLRRRREAPALERSLVLASRFLDGQLPLAFDLLAGERRGKIERSSHVVRAAARMIVNDGGLARRTRQRHLQVALVGVSDVEVELELVDIEVLREHRSSRSRSYCPGSGHSASLVFVTYRRCRRLASPWPRPLRSGSTCSACPCPASPCLRPAASTRPWSTPR